MNQTKGLLDEKLSVVIKGILTLGRPAVQKNIFRMLKRGMDNRAKLGEVLPCAAEEFRIYVDSLAWANTLCKEESSKGIIALSTFKDEEWADIFVSFNKKKMNSYCSDFMSSVVVSSEEKITHFIPRGLDYGSARLEEWTKDKLVGKLTVIEKDTEEGITIKIEKEFIPAAILITSSWGHYNGYVFYKTLYILT